jgi:hypothetical protein
MSVLPNACRFSCHYDGALGAIYVSASCSEIVSQLVFGVQKMRNTVEI